MQVTAMQQPVGWRRATIKTTSARPNWAENIIGRIIIPTLMINRPYDYWFSRYDYEEGERILLFSYEANHRTEHVIQYLCNKFGYQVDFAPYDCRGDIGGSRFVSVKSFNGFETALSFMRECSNIVMMNLVQNGTEFQSAVSDHEQNPHGSVLESFHHMFWNITQCPMHVFVKTDTATNSIKIGTRWTHRPTKGENHKELEIHY